MEEVRVQNLEKELDRLYAVDPVTFVAERERLVGNLREEGRREDAEQVKRLRKPTVSAWTINQLSRRDRREIDLLLDAGHRLREAQEGLLAGEGRKSLDEARRTEREALSGLRKAAGRILAEAGRGSETALNRIMETLQAAAVSNEGRELLARGRLTGDLEATGFELLAPLAEGMPPKRRAPERGPSQTKGAGPRKPAAGPRERRAAQERQRQQDRQRLEEARRRLRETRASATAAEKDLRKAERDVGKASRELAQAEERLHEKQAAAAGAQLAVERAEKQLRQAERKAL
jgi:DNA repair exonuclease SbcCD ATPase subunit